MCTTQDGEIHALLIASKAEAEAALMCVKLSILSVF